MVKISDSLYAKLESLNPSGSIKDRMACYILDCAEKRGELKPGDTIVEATSGNTGIALSMLAAERGYRMIVVMPCDMSEERKQMIRAFGAEIVDVGPGDFAGAVVKRAELIEQHNAFCPKQFSNKDNIACHRETTGAEILQQVSVLTPSVQISAFAAGTGTGGTLMGVREALVPVFPNIDIIAVEPTESAVMSGGESGPHSIQGIGDGFIPDIVNMEKVNLVAAVSSEQAIERTKRLTRELGLFVGISAGANVAAAEAYIQSNNPTGIVVTVLPDRQERYMTMLRDS